MPKDWDLSQAKENLPLLTDDSGPPLKRTGFILVRRGRTTPRYHKRWGQSLGHKSVRALLHYLAAAQEAGKSWKRTSRKEKKRISTLVRERVV